MSAAPTLDWPVEALLHRLRRLDPAARVEVVGELESTNTTLCARVQGAKGPVVPTLLVAERQTAGRGRLGRPWLSAPGASLTCSLALPVARTDWSGLSLAVGLATVQALDPSASRLGLKWPNDVWTLGPQAGRKLGGVLIEAVGPPERRVAVIGVGVNIHPLAPAQALPEPVASLDESWPQTSASAALQALLPEWLAHLMAFERTGFGPMVAAYAQRDVLAGRWVRTSDATCPQGCAAGVAPDGALLLHDAQGALHRVVSGEVSVRPLPPQEMEKRC